MNEELAVKEGAFSSSPSEKCSSSKNSRDSWSEVNVLLFIALTFSRGLNSSSFLSFSSSNIAYSFIACSYFANSSCYLFISASYSCLSLANLCSSYILASSSYFCFSISSSFYLLSSFIFISSSFSLIASYSSYNLCSFNNCSFSYSFSFIILYSASSLALICCPRSTLNVSANMSLITFDLKVKVQDISSACFIKRTLLTF